MFFSGWQTGTLADIPDYAPLKLEAVSDNRNSAIPAGCYIIKYAFRKTYSGI